METFTRLVSRDLQSRRSMVIVDSTVWADYLRGLRNKETDYFDRELGPQRFGLTELILCEALQGIGEENTFTRILRELRKFEIFETGGEELAVEAARNYGSLRRRGTLSARRSTV